MSSYKYFILMINVFIVSGCASISEHHSKDIYKEDYRKIVQEEVKQIVSEFQGGQFPYYHWTAPIVQNVEVPAHLSNGVMIPNHQELVIIKPGEWSMNSAYPINTQQRKEHENKNSNVDSNIADLTPMP